MDARDVAPAEWARSRARSAEVGQRWRRSPAWLMLADAFDEVAATSLPIGRDRALALLSDARWVATLLAPLVAALADDPLFEPPITASRRHGRVGAVLFEAPAARVIATVLPKATGQARAAPTIVVPGRLCVTRYVRSGGARIRRWRIDEAGAAREIAPLFPRDGDVAVHDGRDHGQRVEALDADMVTVTILLHAGAAATTREFRVEDGAPARTASTDDRASRTAMLLTLLRVSGRADAGAAFDAASRDAAPHARWSAMREWLALDALAALPRLRDLANDPDTEVRAAAAATLALVARRRATCPA